MLAARFSSNAARTLRVSSNAEARSREDDEVVFWLAAPRRPGFCRPGMFGQQVRLTWRLGAPRSPVFSFGLRGATRQGREDGVPRRRFKPVFRADPRSEQHREDGVASYRLLRLYSLSVVGEN